MTTAEDYFAVAEQSYWQWQDHGNVVAWADGSTMVFRAELLTVYLRLRGQSLPPFGAVLLLMAACRDAWDQPPNRVGLLAQLLQSGKRPDRLELLQRVAKGLDRVRALDAPLRKSIEAKAELAAMVFEQQAEPALPTTFDRLIAELEQGLSESMLRPRRAQVVVDRLLRDLAWLDRGLARVDAKALALRLSTGLEQSIEPVEIEMPSPAASRKLLSELKEHPELGGIARLAQLLLTAVHLPTPLSFPEELPVGGVSDISNRGSLDRLLLSELANDDLTLAVRVAMNEALYLRREVPPRPPPRRRLVLLDSGMRMWGVPRVFAASVGLALAASADDAINVDVYRAAGGGLAAVEMSSPDGLTQHLAALDHRVHPGEALAALAAKIESAEQACDLVIVTGDDVYADHAFRRQLAELQLAELHVATLGRDGGFRLHLQTPRGHKLVRQAQFALDDLLKPSSRPRAPLLTAPARLPAIFGVEPFPFRLSYAVDAARCWHVEDFGALAYTRDGRLLHWTDADHGALQLAEGLPPGNLHWAASRITGGALHAVIGKLSRQGLHALTVAPGEDCKCVRLAIEMDQPKYAFVHQSVAFVGDEQRLNACSLNTGRLLASRLLGERRHLNARYFAMPQGTSGATRWMSASYNGQTIEFPASLLQHDPKDQLLTVFDAPDSEGAVGVLSSGSLVDLPAKVLREIRHYATDYGFYGLQVHGVSRSGKRLLVGTRGTARRVLVDVRTLSTTEGGTVNGLEWDLLNTAKPVRLRHRFKQIGVDLCGRLTLVGRRETRWPLEYEDLRHAWNLSTRPSRVELRVVSSFNWLEELVPNRYSLSLAQFADGSSAVLDDRGLLHLKSSDASLPEISLVLAEGLTAGWASTPGVTGGSGCCWGPEYYLTDPSPPLQTDTPRDLLMRFARQLK